VKERLDRINKRIANTATGCGRIPETIRLVAVSKTVDAGRVAEAIDAGVVILGENYIQEARDKFNTLYDRAVQWHFIGHLQSNKAKYAVRMFDLIHSVESFKLARALDKEAHKNGKVQDILIQVNISQEGTMGSKILVADDSAIVRHLILKFLEEEDYEIVTTSDSANVVDLIDEINPDLVISDIMMPGMDGYTFVRHIRREKTRESLPVIIMSTKNRKTMEELFVSYGISGYLQKPFEKEQLVALVEKALE